MSDGPKILTLDIETSPNLSWHFDSYKVDIRPIQNVEPSRPICWSAKWADRAKVLFHSEVQDSHAAMLDHIAALMDEADVVVTYNGDRFDLPKLRWAFERWGVKKPSPFVSVDLYKVVKREFGNGPLSKSLAYITDQLQLTGKLEVGGYFPLWLAMSGPDPDAAKKAWAKFTRYSKRDTQTTDELRERLTPYITNLPALTLFSDDEEALACPACKSDNYQRRGHAYTKTRRYPRFFCTDCGKWFRGVRSEKGAGVA
jgi:hypothetical protein